MVERSSSQPPLVTLVLNYPPTGAEMKILGGLKFPQLPPPMVTESKLLISISKKIPAFLQKVLVIIIIINLLFYREQNY